MIRGLTPALFLLQEIALNKLASPLQDKKEDSNFEWKAAIENYYHYYYNKKFHYNKFGIDKRLLEESQDKLYSLDFKEGHDSNHDLRSGLLSGKLQPPFVVDAKKLVDDDEKDDSLEEESIVKKLGTPPQSEDEPDESMLDEHEDRLEIDEEEDFDLEDELGSDAASENSDGKVGSSAGASPKTKLQINRDVSHLDENANCHLSKEETGGTTISSGTIGSNIGSSLAIGQRKIWNPIHCSSKYEQYRSARQDENSQSTVGTMDCSSSITTASSAAINQNSSKSCSIVRSELAKLLLAPVTTANHSATSNGPSITAKANLQSSTKTLSAALSTPSVASKTNSNKPVHSPPQADSQWLNFSTPSNGQPADAYPKRSQSSQLLHSALTGEPLKMPTATSTSFLAFEPFTGGSYSTSIKPDNSSLYALNPQNLLNLDTKFGYLQTPISALGTSFSQASSPAINRAPATLKTVASKVERRRIYKCNYDNCTKKYFKSSHLKGGFMFI